MLHPISGKLMDPNSENILITGGAGFIGSTLALRLVAEGHVVTVLDNLSPQIHSADPESSFTYQRIRDKVRFIQGDIRDAQILREAIEDQTVIIHLASETGTGQSMYEIERYVDVNIRGTSLLLDLLGNTKNKVRKFVLSSSRSVYGEGKYQCAVHGIVYPASRHEKDLSAGNFECSCPVCGNAIVLLATDENTQKDPVSVYGLTKLHQEDLVKLVCKNLHIPYTILRFQNVYGVGQSLSNPYTGILSIFSNLIRTGQTLNIFEDGLESRDFVYIDDIVEALCLSIFAENANNEIFNVGSGNPLNVLEVSETLADALGEKLKYEVTGDFRIGDIRHNFADLVHIHTALGYVPRTDFREGIARFTAWSQQSAVNQSLYAESLDEMQSKGMFVRKN